MIQSNESKEQISAKLNIMSYHERHSDCEQETMIKHIRYNDPNKSLCV